MAYTPKEGSGSLFKNDKKGNERAPNLRGTILLGGVLYELSGWTRERDNGEKWISLSGKVKTAPERSAGASMGIGGADAEDAPF